MDYIEEFYKDNFSNKRAFRYTIDEYIASNGDCRKNFLTYLKGYELYMINYYKDSKLIKESYYKNGKLEKEVIYYA